MKRYTNLTINYNQLFYDTFINGRRWRRDTTPLLVRRQRANPITALTSVPRGTRSQLSGRTYKPLSMVAETLSAEECQFILPYYARLSWNAREPRQKPERLKLPLTHIRYLCTETDKCLNDGECLQAVEDIQRRDMKQGLADIRYNFLIGATGTVFEGRGWTIDADRPAKFAALKGKCLDIAYIGDYSVRHPPWEQTRTAFELLRYGLKKKYIFPTYKIIPYRDVPLLNIPVQ